MCTQKNDAFGVSTTYVLIKKYVKQVSIAHSYLESRDFFLKEESDSDFSVCYSDITCYTPHQVVK